MNYISLMELLNNQVDYSTFKKLHNDFMDGFRAEYERLKPCKSSAEKAVKKYVSGALYRDEKTATYSTGTTVLLLSGFQTEESPSMKIIDLSALILEMMKGKRPTECYFIDSIALYKTLKKQDNSKKYYLKIEDHLYDASLVETMIGCIATSKETYIQAHFCNNGALFIQQNSSAAIVLPVKGNTCPTAQNVNMMDFLKLVDGMEKKYMSDICLTA